MILCDKDFIHVHLPEQCSRTFRKFVMKPFLGDLKTLSRMPNYLELFVKIEKKAIQHYFLFLLSRSDQLSTHLMYKGHSAGFAESLLQEAVEFFTLKGYINDEALHQKKALKKIKKGYALRSVKHHLKTASDEAKNLEKEALNKLILKKHSLLTSKDLKLKQKGYRFFLSRGYSITQINELLHSQEVL